MRCCKYCEHCKQCGRASAQGRRSFGKKYYFCGHEKAYDSYRKYTGERIGNNFIGYGDNTAESPLQVKTSPRWCPMREA